MAQLGMLQCRPPGTGSGAGSGAGRGTDSGAGRGTDPGIGPGTAVDIEPVLAADMLRGLVLVQWQDQPIAGGTGLLGQSLVHRYCTQAGLGTGQDMAQVEEAVDCIAASTRIVAVGKGAHHWEDGGHILVVAGHNLGHSSGHSLDTNYSDAVADCCTVGHYQALETGHIQLGDIRGHCEELVVDRTQHTKDQPRVVAGCDKPEQAVGQASDSSDSQAPVGEMGKLGGHHTAVSRAVEEHIA